jgi:uncharacterized protein
MKFQPDKFSAAVTGYGPGWIEVGGQRIQRSVVLDSEGQRADWRPTRFDDLTAADFEALLAARPELVIFGSGERLRFPKPAWLRPLIEARIGFETMDTPAACRTYNVLAGEGRRVLVALLLESASE